MVKWLVILLAVLGFALGIWTVVTADRDEFEPAPAAPPSLNPYPVGIAASGLVEPAGRSVQIAAPQQGLVFDVFVQVNDPVEQGEALYQLDPRPIEAELLRARAAVATAAARVAQLQAAPRPERVPIAQAAVAAAQAELNLARQELEQVARAAARAAATQQELQRQQARHDAAQARLAEAEASLAELRAGTWQPELAVAEAELQGAQAAVAALELQQARLTVRAPIAGTVLKRRIEPGEFTAPGLASSEAAMVLGDLSTLHVRAQVDEMDAPLLREGAQAIARLRGRRDIRLPLAMVRIEPLAEPKRQLTGLSTELVDTRVIEVIFRITDTQGAAIHPGQIVDVFIEAGGEDIEPQMNADERR